MGSDESRSPVFFGSILNVGVQQIDLSKKDKKMRAYLIEIR